MQGISSRYWLLVLFCNLKHLDNMIEADQNGNSEDILKGIEQLGDDFEKSHDWNKTRCKWVPTSMALLHEAEKKVLSYVQTPYKGQFINIGRVVGKEDNKLWTISLTETKSAGKLPLVMVHGLGSGVALWSLNLDGLAADRHVYAFDVLGFGKSSRVKFSTKPAEAERQLVEALEEWRKQMGLERFALLGHSMGGYVVTSYAIQHPNRVSHLILADPWGFPEKPEDVSQKYPLTFWRKTILYFAQPLNPLFGIRLFGPMGPKIIEKARPDLVSKFSVTNDEGKSEEGTTSPIADYIFHANAQTPSGETAFHTLCDSFAWAKNPMVRRVPDLKKEVPLTVIYGGRSYIDHCTEEMFKELRPAGSYINAQTMQGAGHHVNADDWQAFNRIVLSAARHGDRQQVIPDVEVSLD